MRRILILLIQGYRYLISPMLAPRCRFYPSCSSYALTAIQYHGAGKGSYLASRRILRCHPWCTGGYDPVPGIPTPHSPLCHHQPDQVKLS